MGKYDKDIYRCIICKSKIQLSYGGEWLVDVDPDTGKPVWDGKWNNARYKAFSEYPPRIVCSKDKEHEVGFVQHSDHNAPGCSLEEPIPEQERSKEK